LVSSFLAGAFALSAAGGWGSGDFIAGLVSRRLGPLQAVFITYSVGLLGYVALALGRFEKLPPTSDLLWASAAGLCGMLGVGCLFRGFAIGRMGIVAPVSAVFATIIPVVFAAITSGLPKELQLAGFGLALVSIWLISRPERLGAARPAGLAMALLAGLGFGGFFTALDQVRTSAVFWPLAAARLTPCLGMLVFTLLTRRPVIPPPAPLRMLLVAGLLDAAGNVFFLLAIQSGRLDVAAVLGSLYPGVTAILAWLISGERMIRLQVAGVVLAILAIILITL